MLVADDTRSIHADMRKVLASTRSGEPASMAALLAGRESANAHGTVQFEIDSAYQGEEALELAKLARKTEQPYAVAFVDMSMPPGWNGFETARALLEEDGELQIVLCTASSDFSWHDVYEELGRNDRVLVLKKPYDPIEVLQLAHALAEKWRLGGTARTRLDELESLNKTLSAEVGRREQMEEVLRYDALHDALTRLPNRALLLERIEQCLRRRQREVGYLFALVFLDLDDFKEVNDTLGHKAGDQLLIEVANSILSCVRGTDCTARAKHNTAARLGGDELVVLLDGIDAPDGAVFVTQRIMEAIARPLVLEGREVRASASAGVAVSSDKHRCADDILRDADCALYEAKCRGKERFAVFDERTHRERLGKLRLESELRKAIQVGELCLQFQPIVDLNSDRIHGFEALVRWDHPVHGQLPPSAFVPLAEEKGLIRDIGLWVLREACRHTATWRSRFPDHADIKISINLSRRQVEDPELPAMLARVLAEHGLTMTDLSLELTERLLLDVSRPESQSLAHLQGLDLNLHMDDFGAGVSWLSRLGRFPIRALKLDQGFVHELGRDSTLAPILQAMLAVARSRGLKVIAEGVETPEQFVLLRASGCDYGQGYYFSRPVDAAGIEELLRAGSQRRIA